MLRGARLELTADVDKGRNGEATGVFDLGTGVELSPRIRTGNLIGPTGSQVGAIFDVITGGDNERAGYRLDVGGGAFVVDVSFRNYEGSNGRWGDGTTNDKADAEGEGVYRQLSVLARYLNRGTFDSRDAGKLEWGEYSTSGVFTPIPVAPEEPQVTFAAEEQTSTFDGSISLVAVRNIAEAFSQEQEDK